MVGSGRPGRSLVLIALLVVCGLGAYTGVHAVHQLGRVEAAGFAGLFQYPAWSASHFGAGVVFSVLVPFQLSSAIRRRHPAVHRWSGRAALASSLPLGLTGIALPYAMPARPLSERLFMTAVGLAFLACALRALLAARAGDFSRHRAWMLRTVALGFAPMTQRLVFPLLVGAAGGIADVASFWPLFTAAAWAGVAVNLGLAQWWLAVTRRAPPPP
jgi:predicted membrane protein DUF2306